MENTLFPSKSNMTYIATFYSHFGAICFQKLCETHRIPARLMPVPRTLSSSCGTCVRFEGNLPVPETELPEETEQIAEQMPDGSWRQIWCAEN